MAGPVRLCVGCDAAVPMQRVEDPHIDADQNWAEERRRKEAKQPSKRHARAAPMPACIMTTLEFQRLVILNSLRRYMLGMMEQLLAVLSLASVPVFVLAAPSPCNGGGGGLHRPPIS
eukprot:6199526-Pleurochrysis_carterae.AAC.2